ncbi:MAG: hypothetical protein ACOX8E_12515 [Ruminococcus sp.]|jgi:hypothetical protein
MNKRIFFFLNNRDESIPGNPDDNGFFTEDSTINGKIGNKDNSLIPEGFRPVNTESVKWESETNGPTAESVSDGLVIEDKNRLIENLNAT